MKNYSIEYINKRKDGKLHRIISKKLKLSEVQPYLLKRKKLLKAQIFEIIPYRGLILLANITPQYELQFYSVFDDHFYSCPMTSYNFYPLLNKAIYVQLRYNNNIKK